LNPEHEWLEPQIAAQKTEEEIATTTVRSFSDYIAQAGRTMPGKRTENKKYLRWLSGQQNGPTRKAIHLWPAED
jgi:hypothetical protein